MRLRPGLAVSLVATFTVGACAFDDLSDDEASDDTAVLEQESAVENGHNLNGHNLNGHNLNGHNLNGESLLGDVVKWVSYHGATKDGWLLWNVRLDGSQLKARRGWQHLSGTQLVGARFLGRSDSNLPLLLRVANAFAPGVNDDPTTWRYMIEYRELNGAWVPICVNDEGTAAIPAIPVDGYWDLHEGNPGDGAKITSGAKFLFACEQVGAIGKCVEAGYRPWGKVGHRKLDGFHEACVRLLRADFCGTSVPHTVDGALVNIYDQLGIQDDTEDWAPEAEWDEDGARCISPDATTAGLADAPCLEELLDDDCATSFHHRTLLVSERP
jgi:hypothetical protein